eukprot:TRINITY_DN29074_c0_g1_i1.p1 TRINITY_DN29074_c0_g1~~TRINITY_DN29074_c0_g1_i1.p1  ORF type:complete len:559 (+),score=106.86 TRINITY_DN29074_c0_g1_i1:86-1678(+)
MVPPGQVEDVTDTCIEMSPTAPETPKMVAMPNEAATPLEARKGEMDAAWELKDVEAATPAHDQICSDGSDSMPMAPTAGIPSLSPAWIVNDMDQIKKDVRKQLLSGDKYDVTKHYHKTGVFQAIAKSQIFENMTLCVISTNAVWIAVDTDWNKADTLMTALPVFIIAENLFCVYFTAEIIIRFCSFKNKLKCLQDGWFVFDSILVSVMVMETWIFMLASPDGSSPFGDNTAILRLFRLLRLSRLMKLMKSLPELMILIKGMKTATQSVGYVVLLLLVLTYVFAIACTQLSVDAPEIHEKYFDHVALSMYSLIVYATFLDALSDFCNDIREESEVILIIVIIFIACSALTVMNMLIGVLCEVIASVAQTEKEALLTEQVSVQMSTFLSELDDDNNGTISLTELQKILQMPKALQALDTVGCDPGGLVDFAESRFVDENGEQIELEFDEFMEMVLDLRDSNGATVKDIMGLGKTVNAKIESRQKALLDAIRAQQESIEATVRGSVERLQGELMTTTQRIEERLQRLEKRQPS